ncbi:DUF5916 domain-containing protein [Croceiramulus getboli]|nr:DUF5916 domain-containing protein [Flavobacteriaceae bacterium YJPT1-3]
MKKRFLLGLCTLFTLSFWAQKKEVTVYYTEFPVQVDGILDEKAWEEALPATDFYQYFPTDSLLAEQQSEIYFLYDALTLYVGIKVYTSGAEYVIPSLRRDFRAGGSDNITLMFDTFNDGTNAFLFGSNPAGVRREALVSGGGAELRGFTTSWDTKWRGETRQYDGYYICEWAIPFSAFKFREGETRWRMNSYRFDTMTNESSTWNNIPQNQNIFSLAYMGDMVFERPLGNSKSPISVIPYVNALAIEDFENDDQIFDFKVGGDARMTIGNSLNLDLTINPDFSQVEVDRAITNLTRFEVGLPERRQFFIENSDLFADFGDDRDANPFFSRRIGIATNEDGTTVQNDIIAGARLSGKLNNRFRIGLLNMQTAEDAQAGIAGANNAVVALQHQVFSRSNISFLFVNRQTTGDPEFETMATDYNRVIGLDYNLASIDNTWNGKFYLHKSFTPGVDSNDYSTGAGTEYNSRNFRIYLGGLYIGENFNSDLGFIRRKDIFKVNPRFERLVWPKKGKINRHIFSVLPEVIWRPGLDFEYADHTFVGQWDAEFKNQAQMTARVVNRYTLLFDDFDPTRSQDAVPLAAGTDYNYTSFEAQFRSDRRQTFSYRVQPSLGQFFNGSIYSMELDLNLRIQPFLVASMEGRYDRIDLPEPFASNNLWLVGPRFDITFNRSLFWATLIQYSSQQNNFGINSRLQWRFAPLSDLFLVYNDNYATADLFVPRQRSINLKVTYWLYL